MKRRVLSFILSIAFTLSLLPVYALAQGGEAQVGSPTQIQEPETPTQSPVQTQTPEAPVESPVQTQTPEAPVDSPAQPQELEAPAQSPAPTPELEATPTPKNNGQYAMGYIPIERDVPIPRQSMRLRGAFAPSYITPDLPPVRNQNPFGTCWAHAMLTAAEISLIKQNLADKSSVNLSELQFAWFHHRGPKTDDGSYNDPLNNFGGDYNIHTGDDGIWGGDNYVYAGRSLASWMGPMQEDSATAYSEANAALIEARGLPYTYAFSKDNAYLKNARNIPLDDVDAIKQAILDYGAVTIGYCHNDDLYSSNYYYYLSNENDAPMEIIEGFYFRLFPHNHAVTIVGWDDSIAKSRFVNTEEPDGPASDGAWIVRNSWGSAWGNQGNFYMSYESACVNSYSYGGFCWEVSETEDYDYAYQYDGSASLSSYYDNSVALTPTVANVFQAQHNETLEAVSFWMDDQADVSYTVKVYTGLTDPADPASGTPAVTKSGVTTYAGYYTVDLDQSIFIPKDSYFSVVVAFDNPGGLPFFVPLDASSTYSFITANAFSAAGQSFYSPDGAAWTDVGKDNGGNFRVKAFTKELGAIGITAPTAVYVNESYELEATLPAGFTGKTVTWSVTSGTGSAQIDASTGALTTKTAGTVTVQVVTTDNLAYGEKELTLLPGPKAVASVAVKTPPSQTVYYKNGTLDTAGLTLTVTYDDDKTGEVSTGISASLPQGVTGVQDATATYGGKSAVFPVYIFGFKKVSLTLEGKVVINFYSDFPGFERTGADGYTPGILFFTSSPTEAQIREAYAAGRGVTSFVKNNDGQLCFSYDDIAAKQMNDPIYVVLYAKLSGDTVVYGQPTSISAAQYVQSAFNTYSDTKLRKMLVDMLNYGAMAQGQFDYNTGALANSLLTSAQRAYGSTASPSLSTAMKLYTDSRTSELVKIRTVSLSLENEIAINFYAALAEPEPEPPGSPTELPGSTTELPGSPTELPDVTEAWFLEFDGYTQGGEYTVDTATKKTRMTQVGDYYMGAVANIVAKSMRTKYYARVYMKFEDGTEAYSGVGCYSVESYAYTVRRGSGFSAKLKNLTEAMMRYGDSARAYFG